MYIDDWRQLDVLQRIQIMMKKIPPIAPRRSAIWLSWKLVVILAVSLCVLALFRLHSQTEIPASSSIPASSRLISRNSGDNFSGIQKIAFLFLVSRNLPLDFLWSTFFENGEFGKFSIYIHSEPGFVFDETTTRSHFFYYRQLKNSIKVGWGEASMIEAEKLLLAAALEDPANQRFVLLSDSFLDVKEGRYHPKMSHVIPKDKWRKGSQWITLVRRHAEVIVGDVLVFSLFKKLCRRRAPVDTSKGKQNSRLQKQHNCIPDEHYVQTLLSTSELERQLERRTITYTLWNQMVTKMENKGWHPVTFTYADAGTQHIQEIKDINHVYYETEFRTEWCSSNSTSVPCFLFARKFLRGAAMRLLSEGLFW